MLGRQRPIPRHRKMPGSMNKLEGAYADILAARKLNREIRDFHFEAIRLRLAPNTFYTPDFFVVGNECLEFHEVKGFWEDDARVKIKVAAQMYPEFRFVAVKKARGEWQYEEL